MEPSTTKLDELFNNYIGAHKSAKAGEISETDVSFFDSINENEAQ